MLSSVLRGPPAVRVNIEIMRVFVRLHRKLASNAEAVFQATPVFPVARGSCLPRAPLDRTCVLTHPAPLKNSFATSRRAGALRDQKGIGAQEMREVRP